jgi:carotenoid phi-ring synthase / carotenoid chi-ring synthase
MVAHITADNTGEHYPVVIIGAGLAGLSAGAHLAGRGIAPLILESDWLWPGGRLAGGDPDTFAYAGREWSFKPDHGVHAVWGGYENLRALLERFTETRLQPSAGEEWINRWGREVRMIEAGNAVRSRWIPAPFHYLQLLLHPQIWANITPLDFLSLPGVLVSLLLTVGVDPIAEKRAWDGLTLKEYFRGWTPNLRATFTGLATNLLAADKDDISLTAFIAALRFYTMLRRDAWQMSYFPHDSHTSLIQPLRCAIENIKNANANVKSTGENAGGRIWGGATAKILAQTPTGWQITLEDAQFGGYRTVTAEHVILATNAPGAKRLLTNSPDTRPQANRLIFPDGLRNAVVRLWFATQPREGTPGGMLTGDFVPDNFFWLHRLYPDFDAWSEAGYSAIELHFYGADKLLDQPDRNLLVTAVTEAQQAFPALRGHFVHGVVRRNSKLHTRWRVPTDESLHVVTPWDKLYACGDWVGHETPSFWMERATTTGIAAANHVLHAYGCEPYPLLLPPRPEITARVLSGLLRGGRALLRPLTNVARRKTTPTATS